MFICKYLHLYKMHAQTLSTPMPTAPSFCMARWLHRTCCVWRYQVIQLAQVCGVKTRQALNDFRQYKNNTKVVGATLSSLLQHVQGLPVSSAKCERWFSCINTNDTTTRHCISVKTLASLIFIKIKTVRCGNNSTINHTVEKWLEKGRHSSEDLPTGKITGSSDASSPWTSLFEWLCPMSSDSGVSGTMLIPFGQDISETHSSRTPVL